MSIRISYEGPRGCGHRKAGGIYLVAPGVGAPCGRFPLPVDRCPTCSHGLKQTRGFTWFDPRTFWGPAGCAAVYGPPQAQNRCQVCPAGLALPERAGLLWIGAQYYPTPADFLTEAREQGISRRIAQVPRELEIGQTWIFLAHPRVFRASCPDCAREPRLLQDVPLANPDCPTCDGYGELWTPGVIAVFRPSAIEGVVAEGTSEEQAEGLRRRGIEPVIVRPLTPIHRVGVA